MYFSTALAVTNEVSLRVSYIVDNIIILFYQLLYILKSMEEHDLILKSDWVKGFNL